MVAPLVFVVVSAAGRALVQFATRKAAQNAAKRIGGKVVEKAANKTVSKLPKGGSSKANQALEANTLRASRAAPKGKTKGPDIKPTKADRIGGGGAKPKPKANTKPDARGTATQKGLLLTAGTTAASAVGTGNKDKKPDDSRKEYRPGRGDGKIAERNLAAKKDKTKVKTVTGGAQTVVRNGRPTSENKGKLAASPKTKTWKDVRSVAAAQKAGLDHFTGRDGKKKIAITAEQLAKKKMSLREYANSLRKKGKK